MIITAITPSLFCEGDEEETLVGEKHRSSGTDLTAARSSTVKAYGFLDLTTNLSSLFLNMDAG